MEGLEELLAPAVLPAEEVLSRGSLEFIDSLPTEPPLGLAGRDATAIATLLAVDVNEAMPPLSDNRRFNPTNQYLAGPALAGADTLVDLNPEINPEILYPSEKPEEFWRKHEVRYARQINRKSFNQNRIRFSHPNYVDECIKRKRRRAVMFAMGYFGRLGYSSVRLTPLSRIGC